MWRTKITPRIEWILLFGVVASVGTLWNGCSSVTRKPQATPIFWRTESERVPIDSTIAPDAKVQQYLAPYREEIHRLMSAVVGQAAELLFRQRPEGPLNDLVADWMLGAAEKVSTDSVHIAITNIGGLRANIPAGPITVGKIYEVMPFENELVIVTLNGEQLMQLFQQIAEVGGECIAGATVWLKDHRLYRVRVRGKEIQSTKKYQVVTTDYLSAPGRRRLSVLSKGKRKFLGIKLRTVILEAIKDQSRNGIPIRAPKNPRFIIEP